ncbi:MAG: hypothetical protein WBG47_13405, partial [Gordonia sp. (in: high G+C Gram-positive bacteria)]
MRGQHRKPLKKSTVTRAATTAGALAATATLALSTPNLATAATAPNHSQVVSDFSHALDNFLSGANSANQGGNSIWNPIAKQSGGILPILSSNYTKSDLTDIKNIGAFVSALREIANMPLPWGTTPGALPDIELPGGTTINVSEIFPEKLPGVEALNGVIAMLDGILGIKLGTHTVGSIINDLPLPALGKLIKGLEFTHSEYNNNWKWGALGSGSTQIQNNFLQTPGEIILDLTSIDALEPFLNLITWIPGFDPSNVALNDLLPVDLKLPTATVWVPQGSGQYNLLGFSSGWWAAVPTAALAIPSIIGVNNDPFDLTIAAPITSVGAGLPFGLVEAGNMHMTVMMPLDNGLYSPLEFDMTNVNTAFGFGVTI